MIPNLYVRIRGRVQGPFDEERLRALVRRGQISRIHEVSEDGARWIKAGDMAELFAPPPAPASVAAATNNHKAAESSPAAQLQPTNGYSLTAPQTHTASAPAAGWYYAHNGAQMGPVDITQLQNLLARGQLAHDAHVWTEGMPQWAPARSVPGLVNEPATKDVEEAVTIKRSKDVAASDELVRSLTGSYGWAMFLTVMVYLYALASFVGSILAIIAGAKGDNPAIIGYGLITMVFAILEAVGALLMNIYCNRMARVQILRTTRSVEAALNALRAFWMYLGIVTIVCLAFGVFIAIVVLSAAGAV